MARGRWNVFYSGHELPNESDISGLEARIRQEPDLAVAMSRRTVPVVAAAAPQYEWRVIWRRGNRVIVEPARPDRKTSQIGSQAPERAQPVTSPGVS